MSSTTKPLPPVAANGGCFATMTTYASKAATWVVKTAKTVAVTVAPMFAKIGAFVKTNKIAVIAVGVGAAIGAAMAFFCCKSSSDSVH